jgi:hypothetical protein
VTYRIVTRYEDHLWYPILVKAGGGRCVIREMQGREVNAWNDMVRQQWEQDTKNHPRGWYV